MRVTSLLNSGADIETRDEVCYPTTINPRHAVRFVTVCIVAMPHNYNSNILQFD